LAATSTFTFDFFNHKDQLKAMKDYFTADGFDSFMASLQETGVLTTIIEKKLILSAVAIGPAIVLTEEGIGSKHSWRIQVPLIVRYQSANVDETRTQVVEVLVTQVSTQDAPKGIGIAQYIAREVGPELTR
ncbi:MAG: DotI/IcmL family type IV secretion protein, partial [Gammaproteobacteria bacterium]|nr:DotI/IcmL family type IV secretion protein [Gammaproteobacteria bacterium]